MSSKLNWEGTLPCCRLQRLICTIIPPFNSGASTLPRHVLPLAPPFGFPVPPHLNAPGASSLLSRRCTLQ